MMDKKLDILIPFHYDSNNLEREKAIKRLLAVVGSLKYQKAVPCISDTSDISILDVIKPKIEQPFKYSYRALNKNYYNKSLTINFGVRRLVKSSYFCVLDVDTVAPPNYIENVVKVIRTQGKHFPIRLVHMNFNCSYECFSPNYDDHMKKPGIYDPIGRPWQGFGHGLGAIHTKSFFKIRGYDEEFVGYGMEDDLLNRRIAFINKLLYDESENLTTVHIFHNRKIGGEQYEKNYEFFNKVRKKLVHISKNQNAYSGEDILEAITANSNRDYWGEIF